MNECKLCGMVRTRVSNGVCGECLDEVKQGRGASERLLMWWSRWGVDDAGLLAPIAFTATELVIAQPEFKYILDNWPLALRRLGISGPPVQPVDISVAVQQGVGLTIWCRRFDPHCRAPRASQAR